MSEVSELPKELTWVQRLQKQFRSLIAKLTPTEGEKPESNIFRSGDKKAFKMLIKILEKDGNLPVRVSFKDGGIDNYKLERVRGSFVLDSMTSITCFFFSGALPDIIASVEILPTQDE